MGCYKASNFLFCLIIDDEPNTDIKHGSFEWDFPMASLWYKNQRQLINKLSKIFLSLLGILKYFYDILYIFFLLWFSELV